MPDGIAAWFNKYPDPATTPAYDAAAERLLSTVLALPASATLARPGVRPGDSPTITVDGTAMTVTVGPFGGVITDTAAGGSFIFVVPTSVTKSIGTRPGGGTSRIASVVARIKNDEVRPADGAREVEIYVIPGTAGASPVADAIPTGQLRVRELAIPASGTVSVSKLPQRTTTLGGVLNLNSQAEEDALTGTLAWDGMQIYREDTDVLKVRQNGIWVPQSRTSTHRCHVKLATPQSIPNSAATLVVWDTEVRDPLGTMFTGPSADIVLPVAGDYRVTGRASIDHTTTNGGLLRVNIPLNGTDVASLFRGPADTASTPRVVTGSTTLEGCAAGDVVNMRVFQSTGSAKPTYNGIYCPELIVELVS